MPRTCRLGYVERVIINPHNRRVTAFVTHGSFPDMQHADVYELPDYKAQERRVVVPIGAMRYETR